MQNSKHYERIEEIERSFSKKHRKSKFISTSLKKTWLRDFSDFGEKEKTINTQRNQNSRKNLTNHFVKFWKDR